MVSKQQKRAVIRQLLIPIFLIIAAVLYRPVTGLFTEKSTDSIQTTTADGRELVVSYLDVGQGDATLVSKGDFHMLIDAGNNQKGSKVVADLKERGVDKLDILVGTHPDSDHIGGLDDVLQNIPVDTVYMPAETKETKTYQDVVAVLKKVGKKAEMPEIGKEYTFDSNVLVRFLSPSEEHKDSNDNSIVLQIAYGKNRFLFMGDAEESVEEELLQKGYDLECDVLKLGHHGSYTATSPAFLKKADPAYGIISCGRNNSYGHPHAEVLSRLEDEDVQVYRTDSMGTITAKSDGENVTISTK